MSSRSKRIGFLCECGDLTPNPDGICDTCFDKKWESDQFDRMVAEENLRFDRAERHKFWLGGGAVAFGFIFLLLAIYWSLS